MLKKGRRRSTILSTLGRVAGPWVWWVAGGSRQQQAERGKFQMCAWRGGPTLEDALSPHAFHANRPARVGGATGRPAAHERERIQPDRGGPVSFATPKDASSLPVDCPPFSMSLGAAWRLCLPLAHLTAACRVSAFSLPNKLSTCVRSSSTSNQRGVTSMSDTASIKSVVVIVAMEGMLCIRPYHSQWLRRATKSTVGV